MKRALLVLPLVVLAACGSDDAAPIADDAAPPEAALACIQGEGVDARLEDENVVLVGDDGPKIRFYLTAAEAEAAQFRGEGEGAEQIGPALLFVEPEVTDEGEDMLEDVEACLQDL